MKSHGAFKFIAIGLCALCLLGACGGLAGIFCLSELDLYNNTVDEYLAQSARNYAAEYANQAALEYAGKILGGCSSEMLRAQAYEQHGDPDWFYRLYPDHGYEILDAEGRVVSSYNLENAQADANAVCYTFPETGKYMHFLGFVGQAELEAEKTVPRTVAEGEEYLYDAVQPMGSYVSRIRFYSGNRLVDFAPGGTIGILFHDEMGRVLFRALATIPYEITNNTPDYFCCLDETGEIIYEVSSAEPVGTMTYDESGYLVFRSNDPEPEAVETTVAETVPETALAETTAETTASTEETTTSTETAAETTASSASETPTEESLPQTTAAETTVPETTEVTVPATAAPAAAQGSTLPDTEVTEPVMIDDKPLSSYQINRISYHDATTDEDVTAKYVYVTMPELTVRLYVDPTGGEDAAMWNGVRLLRDLRGLLLPVVCVSLLLFAVTAVYLCGVAGRKPGIPEVRAGGLNRLPLDLYLVLAGGLTAGCVAGGAAACVYLMPSDLTTGVGLGALLMYLGCVAFVGFCFAAAAQLKTPDGFLWRNSLCGRCLSLCVRFARWLESILSNRAWPWLVGLARKLWHSLSRGGAWLEKRVNRMISFLPLTWQWLLAGGLCLAFFVMSRGSLWSLILWAAVICYGAYCFGKLMDSASRMSKGDLNIKVDEKHMVGAFSQFAQSLNSLADATVLAAKRQFKSERMKTELITNVSHDIKTPLTSIINYVDLLEKAQTEQERKEYLEVLDRQSQRLKKLIDDLMEMSKASTGNMSVFITQVDGVESVNQALGEFADKLDRANLIPVFRHEEPFMPMMADGKLVWRVLSNLLGNAVKYALPGTRLYIDLTRLEGKVVLSVKNISREELNVDSEELMERFVRGDDSRNTEGSGLGLNIAKSLMELQKGELQLLVDGDLFKVTLIFPGI